MGLHTIIASVFGIGFIQKGGGTVAAIAFCIGWFFLPAGYVNTYWQLIVTFSICAVGTWSSNVVDPLWGKDSSKVVIDEVAGMAIALLYAPHNIIFTLVALVFFRLFDIFKPLGIRQLEKLPKGWGVMADDILAGIYAFIIIRLVIYTGWLQ